MNLLGTPEGQARKMLTDPDDEPAAGDVPTREARLERALRELMAAYERRVRSDCDRLQAELQPWRCMEYVAAEQALESREGTGR